MITKKGTMIGNGPSLLTFDIPKHYTTNPILFNAIRSLSIQIKNCSLKDWDANLLDCCELVLPDEDLAEYSNPAVVPELSSKEALELAATKKRYIQHHQNNHSKVGVRFIMKRVGNIGLL
jgi:hypothetical protein